MMPAKKIVPNELANTYFTNSSPSIPICFKKKVRMGTKIIPPPTPKRPLRKPPISPKKKSINMDVNSTTLLIC